MGGAQYQAGQLISHLLEVGRYEIYYLTRQVPKSKPAGHEVMQIASHKGFRKYGEFLDTSRLLKLLEEVSPDVIYQRVGCAYTGIAAYYAKKRRKRCIWHVAHDQEVMPFEWRLRRNAPLRYIEKLMLEYGARNAEAVVTQTHYQADCLQRFYGRKAHVVVPNYHPLPPEEGGKKRGRKTVVWVANLKRWKRPGLFMQLARDLSSRKDVEFVMIGEPMESPEWCDETLREAEGLHNLSYLGGKSLEEVNAVLSEAHLFVNTSTREGFPNTFIQSWLRSVPVLSLSVNPDGVFDNQDVGLFCETYDVLRSSLIALLDDDDRRERMGEEARRYAERTYANRGNLETLARLILEPPQKSPMPRIGSARGLAGGGGAS